MFHGAPDGCCAQVNGAGATELALEATNRRPLGAYDYNGSIRHSRSPEN
jgi:hypothetical protein